MTELYSEPWLPLIFVLRTWPTFCLLQFCHLYCLSFYFSFLMHADYTDIQIFPLNTFMLSIHAQNVHTFIHLERRVLLPILSSGHFSLGDTAFSHCNIVTETTVKLLTGSICSAHRLENALMSQILQSPFSAREKFCKN